MDNNAHLQSKLAKMFLLPILVFLPTLSYSLEATDLRGKRYCEVIYSHGLSGFVFNTINLNDCPENAWSKLSAQEIKKTTGAYFVYLNGPRYFVIDGARNTEFVNAKLETFGGLKMRKLATLHFSAHDLMKGAAPYYEHKVERKTTWIFQTGKPVFELIDPKGRVFVMQSYSCQFVKQTEASLSGLGSRLQLPKGWHFKTGILKKESDLVAVNNHAIVVQDDFKNTYQLASKDFVF